MSMLAHAFVRVCSGGALTAKLEGLNQGLGGLMKRLTLTHSSVSSSIYMVVALARLLDHPD